VDSDTGKKVGVSESFISDIRKKLLKGGGLCPRHVGRCGRKRIIIPKDDNVLVSASSNKQLRERIISTGLRAC